MTCVCSGRELAGRHRRRHPVEARSSVLCPDRCVCAPVGLVPCDWCVDTSPSATQDGQTDGHVSCEGCGYGTAQQVRAIDDGRQPGLLKWVPKSKNLGF